MRPTQIEKPPRSSGKMRVAELSAESSSREVIVYIGEIVHEQLHTVKGVDIESLPLWLRTPKVLRKKRVRDAIAEIVQISFTSRTRRLACH